MTEQRIAVVIGSTRPTRICADIAAWACDTIQDGSALSYELLDLAKVNLPFLDEPLKAALHQYEHEHEHEHTRAWSRTIEGYDGFVFVFPQYNWGYPGVLKNALEAVITDDDVDANWQLTDVDATLRPTASQLRAIDTQLTEALDDRQ